MEEKYHFGIWLTAMLNDHQMTQSELGREAGVTRATINGVIKGGKAPGVKLCQSIAKVFRLAPDEVFREAGLLPTKNKSTLERINHLMSLLPEKDQQDVIDYINMKIDRNKRNSHSESLD